MAQRCLYGVDKNEMATDLAKLSLWLATLARDHEFEFVDHALKTGDSLVGLSLSQIEAANWDEAKPGLPLFERLVKDRIEEALAARTEIREAPDDVRRFIQEVRHQKLENRLEPIRMMGDAIIAAFFSEAKARARELARQKVESLFTASLHPDWDGISKTAATLRQGEHPICPFHWQLEFPEVFETQESGIRRDRRQSTVRGQEYDRGGPPYALSGVAADAPRGRTRQRGPRRALLPSGV